MTTELPARVRRGYALGSVATGTFGTVPGLLLLPYLTDTIGVGAALAGVLVFAPKAWDVVLNPIAGRISDRSTHPAGRRRPFLVRAGLTLAVLFAVLFAGPSEPRVLAAAWVAVAFLGCASAYAFFQVPYVAMPAELTLDYEERTRLMTWRVVVLALAILVSGATAPLVADQLGHRAMGVYVGAVIALGVLGAWWGTRGAPEHPGEAAPGTFADQLRLVASNADFRAVLLTFMVQAAAIGTVLAGVAYVADDLLDSAAAHTFLFLAFVGPALLVTPLWERYAHTRGKRSGYAFSSAFLIVGMTTLLTAHAGWTTLTYVAAALVGIGYAGAQVFPMAMLPDVAADDAQRSGANRIGVFTGVWTAGETLGLAMGPGIFAIALTVGGYVSSTGDETVTQPDGARLAIALGFSLVPAVLTALSLVALRGYRLDDRLRSADVA
ncbi:MFS transporter [Aeromicrobium flavum]|uniref:MFS transporter n=1 Tax=Aeromicrobium flavum TaxID=416568 RepID=A0A512HT61_9ACTN|nr:MFS transporter [Aeromicrobium flavum]GEO88652.1 MFS transporter [Aeromicrobium flavum]